MITRTARCARRIGIPSFSSSRPVSLIPLRHSLFSLPRVPYRTMTSSEWTTPLREFPTSDLPLFEQSAEIEEETLPTYEPEKYYPVQQGEVLHNKYQVLAKLGYGVTSTVWLGRDLCDSKYVVLKIYVTGQNRNHELEIYKRMDAVEAHHPGKDFIRKLLDHFSIEGPHGQHICLVHQPLGMSADTLLQKYIPGKLMTLEEMKPCIRQLLIGLDFLHSAAHIIHTDLQLKNMLLPVTDIKKLSSLEEREVNAPSPRKVLKDRTIYLSTIYNAGGDGLPLLSDFGEARFGDVENNADIMPNMYRAPEVVFKESWDYKVDIWNVAMVAWDIVCSRHIFNGKNPDGIFDDRVHVAEMIALLGPPPAEFRERCKLAYVFWDEQGNWKDLAPIPDISLESLGADIRGKDKEGFFRWLRAALQWNAEDRPSATDLLFDEWLMEGLGLNTKKENAKN
ncbi:kinase domain protein [Aspergillus sclerotioniger CBS 115572]|uniref:non-specific serine/threonine protein kinase n=1 Tax=Aspergillus sclerotioniger CBS 115572 TaxID=1450535 RepID=A0A317XBG7_9EURO|nr:kinase domain protein [Aspergillus sclerotioniger CBS 115572]PWY95974.1 kinase domain protein [Aspergillus sclerotioniger CBS 115572]